MQNETNTIFINTEDCEKLIEEIYLIRSSIKEMIKKIQKENLKQMTCKKKASLYAEHLIFDV